MNNKVLVAMSGGVDSSVAALQLKERGFSCTGVTMRLVRNEDVEISSKKTCCSLEDTEDARSVAFRIGIPYYVFNFTDDFGKQVISRFISAYDKGDTPNPCIDCNRYIKWAKLYARAEMMGCDFIATGHYAQIEKSSNRYMLKKAVDETKDQTYFLYFMSQEQLSHTLFPIGGARKPEIRKLAEKYDLVTADKHESQDICFVPGGDYARTIEMLTGKTYPHGKIINRNGEELGEHKGIIRYTIGQRKGLGIGLGEPAYVCEKRISDNTIVLGGNEDLYSNDLNASDFNWIAFDKPPASMRVKAKIRHSQDEHWATVTPTGIDSVHLGFEKPQRAVTKGQAVVLYDGDIVIGGGTIC